VNAYPVAISLDGEAKPYPRRTTLLSRFLSHEQLALLKRFRKELEAKRAFISQAEKNRHIKLRMRIATRPAKSNI
jgi:hypothetical protein